MNKVFLGLILTVCILGMALVMLNDRLGRKQEPRTPAASVEQPLGPARELAELTEARERQQAIEALSPPVQERQLPTEPTPASGKGAPLETEAIKDEAPLAPPKPAEPPMAQPPVEIKPEAVKPVAKPEPRPRPELDKPRPEPEKARPEAVKPQVAQKQETTSEPPRVAPKPEAPRNTEKTATKFVVYARDKGATVRIGGNSKVEYSSMTLEDPHRVVVDLAGEWKFPPNLGIPKNELVSAVRVGQNGDKTRVVIDLKAQPRKVLLVPFKSGDGVDVRVDK